METLLTADEVRDVLRVSRRTFESMVAKRKVPLFILVGRQRRWRRTDVEAWISTLAEAATSARRASTPIELEVSR